MSDQTVMNRAEGMAAALGDESWRSWTQEQANEVEEVIDSLRRMVRDRDDGCCISCPPASSPAHDPLTCTCCQIALAATKERDTRAAMSMMASGVCSMCGSPGPIGSVCDRCPCAYTRAGIGPTCDDCGTQLPHGSEDPSSGIKLCPDAPHGCQARRRAAAARAADEKLDGYRELGGATAKAKQEREDARRFARSLVAKVRRVQAHIEAGGANKDLTAATVLCSEIIAEDEWGTV
jgi:hypothetical protein